MKYLNKCISKGRVKKNKKVTIITTGGVSILSDVPDILHVQHQFFEIFISVLGFSKGKNWSSCQKMIFTYLGGGSEPEVIKITSLMTIK